MLYNEKWTNAPAPVDFEKPTLEGLAYVLRHKELWPEGFEWYFYSCETCAMGLAYKLFKGMDAPSSGNMHRVFGIGSWEEAQSLFVSPMIRDPKPEDIAGLIDRYLESRRGHV